MTKKNPNSAVKRKFSVIHKKLEHYADELAKLQKSCKHPNVTHEHHSNTGNYDPSADCYWTEYHCPDCWAHWTENST